MADIHFITDPTAQQIISLIVDTVGPMFTLPYDQSALVTDAASRNSNPLMQFQLPGGTSMQGYADPSISEHMGSTINSLVQALAPFLAAYGLILPILGVIRGIIEIICAMLNPWAIIRAVIKLFAKYIPPFIALFPTFAIITIILGIIKIIIAVVNFCLTVVYPMIQLIINNAKLLKAATKANANQQQKDSAKAKIMALITELINQLGVLEAIKPILDIVFMILGIAGAGFPCHNGDCCTDDVCPPVLKTPPTGPMMLVPATYNPGALIVVPFVYEIQPIGTSADVALLAQVYPYVQDVPDQLNSQVPEPVTQASPAGPPMSSAYIGVQISNSSGSAQPITTPIIKMDAVSGKMTIIDSAAAAFTGIGTYTIVPNYEALIKDGIIGLGCHPDIAAAKDAVNAQFDDINNPMKYPFLPAFNDNYKTMVGQLKGKLSGLGLDDVLDDQIANDCLGILNNFGDYCRATMNQVLTLNVDLFNSEFDVDRNLAKCGYADRVLVSVYPKDANGTLLLKDLPNGVDINVTINTDFGVLENQTSNKTIGAVTAELVALFPGTATLTAQINGGFVADMVNGVVVTRTRTVRFVSDAVLPKRRVVSKQVGSLPHSTLDGVEREPGGR